MAVIPICSIGFYKEQVCPIIQLTRQYERSITDNTFATQNVSRYKIFFLSIAGDIDRRCNGLHHTNNLSVEVNTRCRDDPSGMGYSKKSMSLPATGGIAALYTVYCMENHVKSTHKSFIKREKQSIESHTSEASVNEKQLEALNSYFNKLQNVTKQRSPDMRIGDCGTASNLEQYQVGPNFLGLDEVTTLPDESEQLKIEKGLGSLDDYFGKLSAESESCKFDSSTLNEEILESNSVRMQSSLERDERDESKHDLLPLDSNNFQDNQTSDEASNLYLISILSAINIAVFLFEIASPIKNSDAEYLSLPLIYGAKINELILGGEWWRLVTPMFLHSGFLHVALGCWALLTCGPLVCRGYGSFTFLLIYILGGICGNFSSFVHTPEPTVGGTGPVFAIIGAWLIYQIQNKEVIAKEVSENLFQKAVIATALSCVLSNFGRIDDWTHLGALCAGLVYGFLTCPAAQLDNAQNSQKEGVALVKQWADPCKSLITFIIFILILGSFFLLFEPQLHPSELDGFL